MVSHYRRLRRTAEPMAAFLEQARVLGPKLGPLLVQLPPQFHLVTTAAFTYLRMHRGQAAGGGFDDGELKGWSRRLRAVARSGKDV